MRSRLRLPALLLVALACLGAKKPKPEDALPEAYRRWLTEEVVYIISDFERESFLALKDDTTRQAFVDAFWVARDPTRATAENEFRNEHYKRIQEANKLFGRSKNSPGWRTARGRIYIQLGAPRDRQRWQMADRLYPIEDWFYQGDLSTGMPRFFHVLFFQPHGTGDYQVYDPVIDGPEELVGGMSRPIGDLAPGLSEERMQALQQLGNVSPELARVSLSLIPSDPADFASGHAEPGSSRLVAQIHDYSNRQAIDTRYVEKVGKGIVTVDYSFKNLGARGSFFGGFTPDGKGVLHYLVEMPPESLTLNSYNGRFTGALQVVGRIVTAGDERPVLEIDERIEIDLAAKEFESVKTHPFAFQDIVPLLPGSYLANLAVRNLVSKEFGVVKGEFEVPARPPRGLGLSPIILAVRSLPATEEGIRPFQIGERAWYPAVDATFPLAGEMQAVFQVTYPTAGRASDDELAVRYFVVSGGEDGDEVIASFERVKLDPSADRGIAVGALRAAVRDLPSGSYRLRVEVSGAPGERVSRSTPFTLRYDAPLVAPWLYVSRRPHDAGTVALLLAEQHLAKGEDEAAIALYREATAGTATENEARVRLAEVELKRKNFAGAVAAIAPLTEKAPQSYAFLLQGLALSGMGKGAEAIAAYERALGESPQSTRVLNVLAEEYLRSGNRGKAIEFFRRSLERDPEQPSVSAILKRASAEAAPR